MTDPHGLESPNSKLLPRGTGTSRSWQHQKIILAVDSVLSVPNFEVQSDHSRLGVVLFKPSWPRIHPLADARRDPLHGELSNRCVG